MCTNTSSLAPCMYTLNNCLAIHLLLHLLAMVHGRSLVVIVEGGRLLVWVSMVCSLVCISPVFRLCVHMCGVFL